MSLVARTFVVQGFLLGLCLPINVEEHRSETLVKAVQGEPAILPCHTDHGMPVVWMFQSHRAAPARELSNSGQIINGYNKYFQLDTIAKGDYNLVIKSANYSNAGLYTCDEEDGIGDRHKITVNVSDRYSDATIAQVGGNVKLPCHLTSLSSTADWQFKPSDDLAADIDRLKNSIDSSVRGQLNLLIRNAQPSDSGVYTCLEDDGQHKRERAVRTLQVFVPTSMAGRYTTTSKEYGDPPVDTINQGFAINMPVLVVIVVIVVVSITILGTLTTVYLLRRRIVKSDVDLETTQPNTNEPGLVTPSKSPSKRLSAVSLRRDSSSCFISDIFSVELDQCPRLYEIFATEMANHIREKDGSVNGIIALDESDLPSDELATHVANVLHLPLTSIRQCDMLTEESIQNTCKSLLSAQSLPSEFTGNVCGPGEKVVIIGIKGTKDVMKTAVDLAREHDLQIAETICLFKTSTESDDLTYRVDWTLFDLTSHGCQRNYN